MDEGTGGELEEWIKHFFPNASAENRNGREGDSLPVSYLSNSHQQNKSIAAMTLNINSNMRRHSQQRTSDSPNSSVRQSMSNIEAVPQIQTSANMVSKLQQHQLLQKQALEQGAGRPNVYQFSAQPMRNLRQHQQVQASIGCHSTSPMAKHHQGAFNVLQNTDQITLQRKSGLVREQVHPELCTSAFHQSQNLALIDQLKPGNQLQTMHPGPLQVSESTPQVELTNTVDWVNQAYNMVQQYNEKYIYDVIKYTSKAKEEERWATNVEEINRCQNIRFQTDRIFSFLNNSRSDLSLLGKERVYQTMNDIDKFMSRGRSRNPLSVKQTQQVEASGIRLEAPRVQQRVNNLQCNSTPANLQESLRQGGALSMPGNSVNSFQYCPSARVQNIDVSSMVSSCPMRPTQSWVPQGNVVPSPHKGSQIGFGERSLGKLLHPSNGVLHHNNLGTSQQTAMRNLCNLLDYPICPISPQNKQQDLTPNRQKMKQPVQQLRRFVGLNQKRCHPLASSSPSPLTPQNSQQYSPQLELKDLSSKIPKSATTLLSGSPSALPSPLTPMTPSSTAADPSKSPLPLEESSKLPKTPSAPDQPSLQDRNQLVADIQGLSKSCVQTESTCPCEKQLSCAKEEDPINHLVGVVKSTSFGALTAAVKDISDVVNFNDRIAVQHLRGEPTHVFFQDLAGDMDFNLVHSTGMESRKTRQLDIRTLNERTTEAEFCSSGSRIKRQRKEHIDMLLEEINGINKKLIEVVVDVVKSGENVSRTRFEESTHIRCSYIPVGSSIEMPNTSKQIYPNLLLELIVTADYPNSSPVVLETMPPGCSDDAEGECMWMKAKTSFSLTLRKFSQPISLEEMAGAWNDCARKVFVEFGEQMGGGSFSSKYGNWVNCTFSD